MEKRCTASKKTVLHGGSRSRRKDVFAEVVCEQTLLVRADLGIEAFREEKRSSAHLAWKFSSPLTCFGTTCYPVSEYLRPHAIHVGGDYTLAEIQNQRIFKVRLNDEGTTRIQS